MNDSGNDGINLIPNSGGQFRSPVYIGEASAILGADLSAIHLRRPRFIQMLDADSSSGSSYIHPASSFDIKAFLVDDDPAKVKIRGGYVRYMGHHNTPVDDTDVTITGTLSDPTFVALQYDTQTGEITVVTLATEPDDSGTNWFRVIWEMYLLSGAAKVKRDRRTDWLMGSPIR